MQSRIACSTYASRVADALFDSDRARVIQKSGFISGYASVDQRKPIMRHLMISSS